MVGFFTVGNLLTLGIVLLILILFRQTDRNSRNLKLIRDYSERTKKELASFVEEQEKAVKDYGVSLNVERDSARELLKRLQITEEELAEKAAAVARIDNQIKGYESSLAELDRMAGRVQENLSRIRDESAFVESAGKRLTEAKGQLEDLSKNLETLENRFERENAESLEKTAQAVIAAVSSTVSDLGAAASAAEHRVEDYYKEMRGADETRAANVAKEMESINRILKTAVEEAGKKADRMEDSALSRLKEQAEERILKLKTSEEERLRGYQESAKTRITEIQNHIKGFREEWRAERTEWETRDKAYRDERKKDIQELNALFAGAESRVNGAREGMEKRMDELSARADGIISSQGTLLLKTAEEMKQKALEITGVKLEEYRHAQDAEFRRLETLTEDSRKLDAELRLSMREVVDRVREDFSRHEREAADIRKAETDRFSAAAGALREEMRSIENEIAVLKGAAYDNVSEKLKVFEDDFFADLSRRGGEIDKRLDDWQGNLDARLSQMGGEAETGRRELERGITDEMRKKLALEDERLVAELDHLKAEASAFEEGIRGQMNAADESVVSYKAELERNFEEARKEAEIFIRAETGKHSLAAVETVKQYQRELDGKLREISDFVQNRSGEITGLVEASRADLNEARDGLAAKVKELDSTIEDARRRVHDLASETDTRIASVRSSVDDAERHIRDAVDQTKLIDRAEELRLETERRMEDLRGDMDRLEQRRAEAAQLENEFVKIRRLEDDVNAKMTRFLSEKRRIETMEADFNRLLQISRAVEEKLTQVTSSDDILQGVQLQIRKLEESLGATEDKYQRLERKSQVLDNTNDGVDRNFKSLQESEKLSAKIGGDLSRYAEDLETVKSAILKLADESEKAKDAADKIGVLDNALLEIEERLKSMQRVRQWLADAETRFEALNREAQVQSRAIDSIVKGKKSGAAPDLGPGAPPQQKKENVHILTQKGWTKEEIAKALKMSLGEVELILEMTPRD